MKDKTVWQLAFGVLVVALVLSATGKLPGLQGVTGAATGTTTPVAVTGAEVGVVVSCYQEETGVTYGLESATISILDASGATVFREYVASGSKSLDTTYGLKKGGKYTVVCEQNSNVGAYRATKDITFDKDVNVAEVAMRSVGVPSLTLYAGGVQNADLIMTNSSYKYIEFDLSTSATKTWLYKPIVAIKDASGSILSGGAITDLQVEHAVKVSCDTDAMVGYTNCWQVDQEWVSSQASISKTKIYFTSKAIIPSGNLTISVFDGVPGSAAGTASINQANAYSTVQVDANQNIHA